MRKSVYHAVIVIFTIHMQKTLGCTESSKALRRAESIDYVTFMRAEFLLLVPVALKAPAAALAGQAVIRLSVDLVGIFLPPDHPAPVAAERPGAAFSVLRNRIPAVAAALFPVGLTAANRLDRVGRDIQPRSDLRERQPLAAQRQNG